jgi:septal ring factor EnvC (AmiA/AmiB activator)
MTKKNTQILELEKSNELINALFHENKEKVKLQFEKIEVLETCISDLKTDRDNLQANMSDMKLQNNNLETNIDSINNKLEKESNEKKMIHSVIDTFLNSNVDYILNELLHVDDHILLPNVIEYKCYETIVEKTKQYFKQ